jgi:heme oxygenase
MTEITTLSPPLSRRLKAESQAAHEALDAAIMAGDPFASRERYALFLHVQHQFHRDIRPVYEDRRIEALLPDLEERCRLHAIEADLRDLGCEPSSEASAALSEDLATRLGWLYVAEGSNLGAAFLIKAAAKLGLDEGFGARHLAAAPQGRGLHWKQFQGALDAAGLDEDGEMRAIRGAMAAFNRVQALVDRFFGRNGA